MQTNHYKQGKIKLKVFLFIKFIIGTVYLAAS
jgi:hypothetical protein